MIKAVLEISNLTLKNQSVNKNDILSINIAFAEYAQPIISPDKDLHPNPENAKLTYFANMHNIYPNDRGQNRAFEIGFNRAQEIIKDLKRS